MQQQRYRDAVCFFFKDTATTEIYTLSLHDALPISLRARVRRAEPLEVRRGARLGGAAARARRGGDFRRSEEHTSELQSRQYLVCRLLLEKKLNHRDFSLSNPVFSPNKH